MPRVVYRHRPPWYNASVSKEVGRVAGVTTRPAFLDPHIGFIWNNKNAATTHPIAHRRLVQVRPPSEKLSPQLQLDSRSANRAAMFARQGTGVAGLAMQDLENKTATTTHLPDQRQRGFLKQWNDVNAARKMHEFMSPERVFRSAYHSVKPNQTLPYKPATPKSGSTPKVPRPSSGVSPKIAGAGAAAILKGTGALGFLPGILHLARGGSIMDLVPPAPGHRTQYIGRG